MKKLLFSLIALCMIVVSISCDKEEDCTHPLNSMNLDELEVGQVFRFVLLKGESYSDPDNFDFEYTGDTLKVKVVDQLGGKFILSETITPHSNMMFDTAQYYWYDKDSVYTNFWEIKDDSLFVSPITNRSYIQSHLLFHLRQYPLANFTDTETTIRGWKTDPPVPIPDPTLFTKDYTLLGHSYDRLNILVENGPMAYDGNGVTQFYSRKHGFVKTTTYSAWTSEGIGWDRLD